MISENIGAESVMNILFGCIGSEKPDVRSAGLQFMLKNTKSLYKIDSKIYTLPVLSAVQDRSKETRIMAEELLGELIREHGYTSFENAIRQFKPFIQTSIRAIIRRLREESARSCSLGKFTPGDTSFD